MLGAAVALGYGQLEGAAGQADEAPAAQAKANATRTNEGGAVTFEVTLLGMDGASDTLDFEVAMNTHSVELGFDLAKLAVLRTDTGAKVAPSAYRGGSGHHVTGLLSFPAGQLADASTLKLLIRDVAGVAEREFVWQLQ